MARYIDADALIEALQVDFNREGAETFKYSIQNGRAYEIIKHSHGQLCFLNAIERVKDAPTANVAPIADTVKKMQERLKELAFPESECGWDCVYIRQVDGVAKEILEGTQND